MNLDFKQFVLTLLISILGGGAGAWLFLKVHPPTLVQTILSEPDGGRRASETIDCEAEIKKNCAEETAECIAANFDYLPPSCSEVARRKLFALIPDCSEDANKLCANVKPGGGRIDQCLRHFEKRLGEKCRARLFAKPQ